MAYYDKDGNEIEGLMTPAEVDAKIDTATSDVVKQYEEEKKATDALKAQEAADKAAVDKAGESGDKENNLAALRKKLEETQGQLKTATEANEGKWKTVKEEKIGLAVSAVAGTDEELAKKVKHHLSSTLSAMPEDTQEQIKAKVTAAYKLSSDAPLRVDPLSFALGGTNRGVDVKSGAAAKPFTETEKVIGNKLGISDEDYKKYGNKV
jgi:predicted small metal-binding protein